MPQPVAVASIDHHVPHISTVPANRGESVGIFVREKYVGDAAAKPAVLMVHGGFSPSTLAFDLQHETYGWMDYLARAGFDVFAMDMSGYGGSARPMMDDPCNIDPTLRASLGIDVSGEPSYPFELNSSQSEWDEIDCVVEHIRALRRVPKVNLVGWSGGGKRTGSYTSRHADKVARLVIFASSNYASDGPGAPPPNLPRSGFPMTAQNRTVAEQKRWNPYLRRDGQIDPGMQDRIWRLAMAGDPVGAGWGPGVMRAPTRTYWGWNREAARRVTVPTLIMIGEYDDLMESNRALYGDLGATEKSFVGIAGGSHFMLWEKQHRILQEGSREWLMQGTFNGASTGRFWADFEGQIAPV